ncbi:unnamed protein product [Lactuca saligna]|uniref:ATP synthase F1 complex delta/epsilon subunit N-terminal domain-containing protein n=1 Tax=Lactuca saligna TaxID=75948 RepID=A0AA35VK96_LACSI|nr:unnamed protein product [Lactuca saligna]
MTLNLCVLTPNRILWDSEVKEIILSTNSGQIGVLPNQAPIATSVDIGILRLHLNDQWLTMALMGGFARIGELSRRSETASVHLVSNSVATKMKHFPLEGVVIFLMKSRAQLANSTPGSLGDHISLRRQYVLGRGLPREPVAHPDGEDGHYSPSLLTFLLLLLLATPLIIIKRNSTEAIRKLLNLL